jgi:hypothetical protein
MTIFNSYVSLPEGNHLKWELTRTGDVNKKGLNSEQVDFSRNNEEFIIQNWTASDKPLTMTF